MVPKYPWYDVIQESTLEQGDMFFSLQVVEPVLSKTVTAGAEVETAAIVRDFDIVVLSQSCDLVQGKLESVLVCPHWSIDEYEAIGGDFFRSRNGREEIRRGNVPGLHMLAQCDLPGFNSPIRIAGFRQAFSVPFSFLLQLANSSNPRLRLLPPYREHLAQAFARFIMRVGLPVDIPPFK